jgi:hypothetical protein
MIGRFDYVRYDLDHSVMQQQFKDRVLELEAKIEELPGGRAKSLALTKLEECYMWIGKAVRDHQIEHGGSAADVPERGETGLKSY